MWRYDRYVLKYTLDIPYLHNEWATSLRPQSVCISQFSHHSSNQLKLLGVAVFRDLANYLTSPRIMAGLLTVAVLVLGVEVVVPLDDEVRRHDPAIRTYSLDHCNPLSIARLLCTRPTAAIGACHGLCTRKDAHLEPGLVEVIDVPLLDPVLLNHISYKPKPRVYYVGIFALGLLVID